MTGGHRVQWLHLDDGAAIRAEKAVCPICETLDLATDFARLGHGRYRLTCPTCGRSWIIEP